MVSDLFGDYYRRVEPLESRRLERGQFCWAPILYLPQRAQSVAVRSYNPADERGNRYAIVSAQADDPARFDHAPIHEIKLEYNEGLYAVKGKVRPVIIMSQRNEEWQPGGGRLAERGLACVPVYSFQQRDSPEFRARVRAHEYPWWIYLPEGSVIRESFMRLDRIQVIEESRLRPMRTALAEDALWFVSEWMRYCMTGEIDPMLEEYRRDALQAIRNQS